jgi:hypothetical protein
MVKVVQEVYTGDVPPEPIEDPPDTEPPDTEPPDTEPPDTEPPDTEPPDTEPPDTEPPDTEQPDTEPPGDGQKDSTPTNTGDYGNDPGVITDEYGADSNYAISDNLLILAIAISVIVFSIIAFIFMNRRPEDWEE